MVDTPGKKENLISCESALTQLVKKMNEGKQRSGNRATQWLIWVVTLAILVSLSYYLFCPYMKPVKMGSPNNVQIKTARKALKKFDPAFLLKMLQRVPVINEREHTSLVTLIQAQVSARNINSKIMVDPLPQIEKIHRFYGMLNQKSQKNYQFIRFHLKKCLGEFHPLFEQSLFFPVTGLPGKGATLPSQFFRSSKGTGDEKDIFFPGN